ncbi:MAG TPA: sulfate permease [Candidatus Sulfomarinibacteraceae bacterium]|nr:sulfate permease [Candidatus Sulfomarinibacteraceae bacterium]
MTESVDHSAISSERANGVQVNDARGAFSIGRYLPVLRWAAEYRRAYLVGDLMAGLIVAIMLVPQSMAYALLAGLPPQVGLYASVVPLILYGLLGTSRSLAVGPVAIVSLLVASGIGPLAATTAEYVQLALTLALLVGVIQLLLGLARVGFLVNFMSHPVLAGFTSAAALVIALSQVKHLVGIDAPRLGFGELAVYIVQHLNDTNLVTLALGGGSILLLLYFKTRLAGQLRRRGVPDRIALPLTKAAPLVVVLLGTLLVSALQLNGAAGVRVVGDVPAGLPPFTLPTAGLSAWHVLLPTALAISFVGYMESIAVAKSLASKRRQRVDANQELVALGMANFGAALGGGYPVTGGFSRSVVNHEAGANSGLASIITAGLILLTILFLTPLFYFLPQAVLAAIVVVAVAGLVDVRTLKHVWRYNKADAASFIVTFLTVLLLDVERGIVIGIASALLLYIWRTSKPHVAIVGRLGDSETYRNVLRHEVKCWPNVVAMRVDESLYFANTRFLEDVVLAAVADRPEVEHFVLIGTAVNFIDASALETLKSLQQELRDAGVTLHLAAIKGPVLDRLRRVGFTEQIGAENIHLTTHEAMRAIGCFKVADAEAEDVARRTTEQAVTETVK